ncbi:LpqB family beta-propeller domain-containing protein [Streptomyces qinglanensis]|uniref:Two-component system, OmpR family, sensor histidine kinase MtrB n=1 Tax=Streptomyces qinglanensis TaxID=943816 RepID=A0A1H9WWB0_9ACTN|nr:LpqB family beta-propeller domain-containing protein [Streptomyces qinglanensis]SES38125.1 two-component system, OmpR family, sensor histidine kinase MtrB [Streptomyces qinglanensis]
MRAGEGRTRRGGTAARRRRALVVLASCGALLAGCASMPDGGKVKHVSSSHRSGADSQVRVYSVSPQKGEAPTQIVRGFLEATTSDEATFPTAREYMTRDMARRWDPFASTTVLSDAPDAVKAPPESTAVEGGYSVEVSGDRMAEVDSKHAYSPSEGKYSEVFRLTKVKGEWRIDEMPDGLVLGESDFQRIYRPINTYYYAQLGPDADSITDGQNVLVADPVYLRRRIDPVTETVSALLQGPSGWIDPVVSSSFPRGSRLARGQHLSLDDSGVLRLRLNARAAEAGGMRCARMAAQVLYSVQDQASAKVGKVELAGPEDRQLCSRTREQVAAFQPGRLNGSAKRAYFIDGKHRVASFKRKSASARPVEGPLGSGQVEMGAVAVNRIESEGAAVSRGRRALYVASLEGSSATTALGDPVLTSAAEKEKDRLTAPSWDGLGDLWVADRDPDAPRLLRLRSGKEQPDEVRVPDLGEDERIESLRVASDGVRILLRVRDSEGRASLQLGRVVRGGTVKESRVTVEQLRPVAPQLVDVSAASWAGGSRLVVVGRESGSVQQLQYMETDGSVSDQPTLPGITDVTGVAASEDESKPLLADSEDGIVRLPPDANWRMLTEHGSAPAYPG